MTVRDASTLQTDSPASVDEAAATGRPSAKAIGTKLGRYTIRKLIGRGGVGAVYEAEDPDLDRRVALKLLREDRITDNDGLRREAKALAKLVHQNVVMVYDVGVAEDELFLVMQLIEGMTIDAWVAKHKPDGATILDKFMQAGEGIVAAHAVGLIHCDFKPHNVLVDDRGIVHVGDFGLARRFTSTPGHGEGKGVTIAGTPAYMAPEQFTGKVSAASDQFAFCVALWECLAGERPFEHSPAPILDASLRGERRPLRRGVKIPRHVVSALDRGMSPKPRDRFPTMDALLSALRPKKSGAKVAVLAGAAGLLVGGGLAYFAVRPTDSAAWDGADAVNASPLTNIRGGCAYSPAFDRGGKLVLFDRTVGDIVDLYKVSIDGGEPQQLTDMPSWEWRASPGRRPGEALFLVQDNADADKSMIAYLDLETKKITPVKYVYAVDAAVTSETIYYSPDSSIGIRALVGRDDRSFIHPSAQNQYFQVVAGRESDHLAVTMSGANWGRVKPCVVDIATRNVECFPFATTNRPAFGVDDRALYFATYDGIRRRDLVDGTTTLVAKGAYAEGGVAVAPDGSSLVYSACKEHNSIVDWVPGGANRVVDPEETAVAIALSTKGHMAFVRDVRGERVLVLQTEQGKTQLTEPDIGSVGSVHFDSIGKHIVFTTGEPNPGIRVVDIEQAGTISEVTRDPRAKNAVWIGKRVAFNLADSYLNEQVWWCNPDGTDLKQLSTATRYLYGSNDKELLVATGDSKLYWLDPNNGTERPGPDYPRDEKGMPKRVSHIATSPMGSWVVFRAGVASEEVWRSDSAQITKTERVKRWDAGTHVGLPAITDDGHAIIPLGRYEGDLIRIPARPGKKF